MPAPSKRYGLTAVVLCGAGAGLHSLAAPEKLPKPLLPIANKPMLQHPLEWLQKGGIRSVVIICQDSQEKAIRAFLDEITDVPTTINDEAPKPAVLKYNPTLVSVPSTSEPLGTAEIFRIPQVYEQIKSDFVVIPCDLVCEIPFSSIVQQWLSQSENVGGRKGALGVWYDMGSQKGYEKDIIVTAPLPSHGIATGVDKSSLSTLMVNMGQSLRTEKIRYSLIKTHPKLNVHTTLRDAHIYILPHWILKFIQNNPYNKLHSLRNDVLSWWARASWQGNGLLARKLGILDVLECDLVSTEKPIQHSVFLDTSYEGIAPDNQIYGFMGMSTTRSSLAPPLRRKIVRDSNTRGWFPALSSTTSGSSSPEAKSSISSSSPERVRKIDKDQNNVESSHDATANQAPLFNGLYVPPFTVYNTKLDTTLSAEEPPLLRRVDTVQLYLTTSLAMAKSLHFNADAISPDASIHARSTVIRVDSMIDAGSTIEEKALVKKSILGKMVVISKGAKIDGCVILEGVVIHESSKLEGCIIGRYAKIGKNCVLTNCEIAEDAIVDDGTEAKGEKIISYLAGGDYQNDSDDDDMDSDELSDEDNQSEDDVDVGDDSEEQDAGDDKVDRDEHIDSGSLEKTVIHGKDDPAEVEKAEIDEEDANKSDTSDDEDFEPSDDSSYVSEEYDSGSAAEDEDVDGSELKIPTGGVFEADIQGTQGATTTSSNNDITNTSTAIIGEKDKLMPQQTIKKQLSFASFDVKNLIQPQPQPQAAVEDSQMHPKEQEDVQVKKASSIVDDEGGGVSLSAV